MSNRKADNLLLFKSIVDNGSLSTAAKACNISISQASKRMTQLENLLGIQLLHRSTRRLALTSAGEILYNKLKGIKLQIDEAWESMLEYSNEPRGDLKVSAPIYYGLGVLTDFINQFSHKQPNINVNLELNNNDTSLEETKNEVNIQHHVVSPSQLIPDSNLCAKKIQSDQLVFIVSQQYIDQHGRPNHPEELQQHKCLAINKAKAKEQWTLFLDNTVIKEDINVVFSTNNYESLFKAVSSGMGIAQVPLSLVNKEPPHSTNLIQLFTEYQAETLDTYAYYNASSLSSKKVNLFLAELVEYTNQFKPMPSQACI